MTASQTFAISRVLAVWQTAASYEELLHLLRTETAVKLTAPPFLMTAPGTVLADAIEKEYADVTALLSSFYISDNDNAIITFAPKMPQSSFCYSWVRQESK